MCRLVSSVSKNVLIVIEISILLCLEFFKSLHGEEYVRALFGLDSNLEHLLHVNIDVFYNVVALFLHDTWNCYRYFM